LDMDGSGTLSTTTADRVTDTIQDIESYGSSGYYWATTKTLTYPNASSGSSLTTSVVRERLTGLGSGTLAERLDTDVYSTTTTTDTLVSTSANTVTTQVSNPAFSADATVVTVAGLGISSTGFDGLNTTVAYDSLWRPITQTDSRSNAIHTTYVSGKTLVHTTADGTVTTIATYDYDGAGRRVTTTNANGKKAYVAYTLLDEVSESWGDTVYPAEYGYDAYGQRTSMKTFQNGTWTSGTWPGEPSLTNTTTWAFNEASGLVTTNPNIS